MKPWDKGQEVDVLMEEFTVGNDRVWDERLARWDVVASIAHANMLGKIGLLTSAEAQTLVKTLSELLEEIDQLGITIGTEYEDVHSLIEHRLIQQLGDVGKRIHIGRSRNDQVAVALKMFLRHEMRQLRNVTLDLAQVMLGQAEANETLLVPGYTHMQVAMPSSFGLWYGGYAEALLEDARVIETAIDAANANPLGSAAGYGSTIPLDREMTTEALNFNRLHVTSTFAQMSRGRTERICAMVMANVASTLSRFADDVVLFMSQNFGFVALPDSFTTGSSIMPHKKNPDVFEVLRARLNRLQALPTELSFMVANQTSGYHRDVQFMKDRIIPMIDELRYCIHVAVHVIPHIECKVNLMEDEKYRYAFSVDRVNELVLQGMPFRDAYRTVATEIATGAFASKPVSSNVNAHVGSIGNPGLPILRERLKLERSRRP